MLERDPLLFIDDIIQSIEKIERYSKNLSFEQFEKDEMIIDAVIRNFEIIGEAANNLPNNIKQKYNEVEWRKIVDFRNVMIHSYFGIMNRTLWNTIINNIPIFKKHIIKIRAEYE